MGWALGFWPRPGPLWAGLGDSLILRRQLLGGWGLGVMGAGGALWSERGGGTLGKS